MNGMPWRGAAKWGLGGLTATLICSSTSSAFAQPTEQAAGSSTGDPVEKLVITCWAVAFVGALAALIQARLFYAQMQR
ncbi:MAG: hypothetical protein RID07_14255, partial [Lacipirellulaceae bacterium]